MDDADLKALLLTDAPSTRDVRFELAVMARIERRAFHRALWRNIGIAALATLVLALVSPFLEIAWQQTVAPAFSNLAIALLVLTGSFVWIRFYAERDF